MIKKILFIFICIFLFTGCSDKQIYKDDIINTIYYNLNIQNFYQEDIFTTLSSDAYQKVQNEQEEDIDSLEKVLLYGNSYPLLANRDIIYQKNIISDNNGYHISLNHQYIEDDFVNATFLNTCFEYTDIHSEDQFFEIQLKGKLNCYIDQNIQIWVSTDHNILDCNGTKKDQSYYWIIDHTNHSNVDIHLKYARVKSSMKHNYHNHNSISFYINIAYLFFFIILFILFIVLFKKKGRKSR